jgi:hypothetical protein
MRRKQVAHDLENDPLVSFGEQMGETEVDQKNKFGETKIVLKPRPAV